MESQKYRIDVLDTGVSFFCGEDETILEAMKRAGCGPIHYGCFGGGCGVCKMKIVSGPYAAVKRMSRAHVTGEEQEAGIVLICCAQPRGNLTIARLEPNS